jgi:cell filamentation protein
MIESYANSTVFKDIAKDKHLVGMEKEQFTDRLTHHFAEINALHPFREGNGRSTRQFVEQLANHAGYDKVTTCFH